MGMERESSAHSCGPSGPRGANGCCACRGGVGDLHHGPVRDRRGRLCHSGCRLGTRRGCRDLGDRPAPPASEINPTVVEAMREVGIDLSQEVPKPIADEIVRDCDVVITMGCGDACPVYPGTKYEDWELDDPAGQPIERVREIRDE